MNEKGAKIVCYIGGLSEDRNIEILLKSSEMLSGNLYLAGLVDEKHFNRLQNVYEETYQKNGFIKAF